MTTSAVSRATALISKSSFRGARNDAANQLGTVRNREENTETPHVQQVQHRLKGVSRYGVSYVGRKRTRGKNAI